MAKKKMGSKKAKVKSTQDQTALFNLELIQQYSDFMHTNGLTEIDIQWGEKSLRLKKGHQAQNVQIQAPVMTTAPVQTAVAAPAPNSVVSSNKKNHIVTSPFVGTFYRSPGPNQDAFVEEGKTVHSGDTLCIVEAMKLMNEIESEVKGRVVRALINDGTPVEFGEALFEIEPL
jgi:acetyl-CoA carboxylase biotin carboxyl carrier protein